MAFYGCEFSFDGRSSHEFGLTMYNFGNYRQNDTFSFPSAGKIIEDRPEGRTAPLIYGKDRNEPMEFVLIFGPKEESWLSGFPDRWDVERIAAWLTEPQNYRWLEIDQADTQDVRFRCLISQLESISLEMHPFAFRCKVVCDGPYAYSYPETYVVQLTGGEKRVLLKNTSACEEFYYPSMVIETNGGTEFSIVNHSIGGEELAFTDLPASIFRIFIDGENEVITTDLDVLNPYEKFNLHFLRLQRGDNILSLTGNGNVQFICEFPRNFGG